MRISDWSSDVCSSDLEWGPLVGYLSDAITGTVEELFATRDGLNALKEQWRGRRKFRSNSAALRALDLLSDYPVVTMKRLAQKLGVSRPQALSAINQLMEAGIRSEEHTSELQSLMRISYAVFCLKKK